MLILLSQLIGYAHMLMLIRDEVSEVHSTNVEESNAFRILVTEPEEKDKWEEQDVGGWNK
jgi:hypothetical protein